jgi:hypothetical protein
VTRFNTLRSEGEVSQVEAGAPTRLPCFASSSIEPECVEK